MNNKNSVCKDVMEDNRLLENCNFIKTILMLLVILYHSCVFWTGDWFTKNPIISCEALSIFAKWLDSFHIYGFVLVSGYIYSYSRNEKGKYQDLALFVRTKARRLLIPYCFVACCWAIPLQQLFFHNSWNAIMYDYILAEKPNQLWFLWMLFIVYIMVYSTERFIRTSWLHAALVSVVSYSAYLVLLGRVPNYFQIIMAMQFLSVFLVGYYLRKIRRFRIHYIVWIVIDLILFVLYEYVIKGEQLLNRIAFYGIEFVLHIVGAIMVFTFLQALANKMRWRNSKVFLKLSSLSMPMYLFHQQIIYFSLYYLNGKVAPWINAMINFAVATTGSFAISAILMKWKVSRLLISVK